MEGRMGSGERLPAIPGRTIGRLSLYRRILRDLVPHGIHQIYSHQLAQVAHVTPAQVRRDLMMIGFSGNPAHGYNASAMTDLLTRVLDGEVEQVAVLVGAGNLGHAILAYFLGQPAHLRMVAAFDTDPNKAGRIVQGCRCHALSDLSRIVAEEKATIGIITVPAGEAQRIADALVAAGIRGLVNFAPEPLRVSGHVYVEDVDLAASFERVAFFARNEGRMDELHAR
jgi:redox-sensing transcriptional repressor